MVPELVDHPLAGHLRLQRVSLSIGLWKAAWRLKKELERVVPQSPVPRGVTPSRWTSRRTLWQSDIKYYLSDEYFPMNHIYRILGGRRNFIWNLNEVWDNGS